MQPLRKNHLPVFILLMCSLPLFFINIHNSHSAGGDDYAQYIKEAQNIAQGVPYYRSGYVFNKYNTIYAPPQYPPGYPLLLSPVIKFCGIAIRPLCYFNSFIALCLLLSFFAFFRRYMSAFAAICLSLLVTYSQLLIDLKQFILSDTASLLFIMLYLIYRSRDVFTVRRIILLPIIAAFAMLIRTQNVLLVFAEFLYVVSYIGKELVRQKTLSFRNVVRLPSLYVAAGSVVLYFFIIKVVFNTPADIGSFYAGTFIGNMQKGLPAVIRDNINFLITSVQYLFHYDTGNGIRTAMATVMENCGLVFCIIGFIATISKRLHFRDVYFVLTCFLVLNFPSHDVRYFLPVIAIVYLYCYAALVKVVPLITGIRLRYVAVFLTAVCFITGFRYLKSTTVPPVNYVPDSADMQAFTYIAQHISDTDIIICEKPRMLTLYTGKRCMMHAWQLSHDANKHVFDSVKAKYILVMDKADDGYYKSYLAQLTEPPDSIVIANGYTLYKFQ